MVLQATHSVEAFWCEGGSWKSIAGNPRFFAIYHNSLKASEYNTAFALQTSHTRPDNNRPVDDDLLSQGARWFGDWLVTPNHNGGAEELVGVHFWNGSGFDEGYRVATPLIDANQVYAGLSQGISWDLDPEAAPQLGSTMLFAHRDGVASDGEIVRAAFRRRWGATGL